MRSCYNGLYFWNIHSRRRSWLVFHKILQLLYDIVRVTRLVYIASNTSLFLFQASISFVSFDIVLFHTFFFLPHTSLPFSTVTLCRTPQEYQCFLAQNEWREPSSSIPFFSYERETIPAAFCNISIVCEISIASLIRFINSSRAQFSPSKEKRLRDRRKKIARKLSKRRKEPIMSRASHLISGNEEKRIKRPFTNAARMREN